MEVAQPRDLEQHLRLAKRSRGELCRQKRIFNARSRLLGGDTEAWDFQVHDQKIKEATEKARHETFAAEMRQNDKIMCMLEGRERRDKKSLCKAISDFQQTFQKPETRREFDLSDPLALRKDLPARQSDNDIRNTVSGMQRFMGEDLNFHERKRFQEEQNREWASQQQREQERARAAQRRAEDLYFKTRLQFDETAKHLQNLESATRKAVCAAVKEFNKNQATESVERKTREKKQEEEDNLAEISNLLRGDLLSENPQPAASSLGPHRVVPDRWKGMTREQLEHIRLVQKQQIQEKLVRVSRAPRASAPGAVSHGRRAERGGNEVTGAPAASGRRAAARHGVGPAKGADGSLHAAHGAPAPARAAGPPPGSGLRQPQPGPGAALAEETYGGSLYKSAH
ncbi:RIB43A-like with coiled-coils protein 2 isoform X1 [Hyaena hyaena]|uniref:RIB43A-like with coiled-coils protein 2 isoform X1 n=1 Tax=Hyaena hyaena TaxID=95912 RepID=UPI001923E997|nr:RIB43A-like with coiled-coils protein 2 isoform X1 [Hyaena hyaena]